ncbi:MAG: hypothetical protein ACFFBD_03145 [Candidatus Hodarchaeota archaeon]
MSSDEEIYANMNQISDLICRLLHVESPFNFKFFLPSRYKATQRIVVISLDNFGLFEVVNFKPEFLVHLYQNLLLLDTTYPDSDSVLRTIITGDNPKFNLFQHLNAYGKKVHVTGRATLTAYVPAGVDSHTASNDMTAYIDSTKNLNRNALLFIQFADLGLLAEQYSGIRSPDQIVSQTLDRTSNWLKILYNQAKEQTTFLIIGNHGTKSTEKLDYKLDQQKEKLRRANLPIALVSMK